MGGNERMMTAAKTRFKKRWLILFALLALLLFYPLPYYYSQPGSAQTLDEIINVENGYEEKGAFMLTTVQMGRATIPFYIWAKLSPHRSLLPIKQLQYEGETDEDYHRRQLLVMKQSQDAAKIVAYHRADKEFEIAYKGVLVTSLIEGMPASEVLKSGDRIIQVDGNDVQTAEQFMTRIQGKTHTDHVNLTIVREGIEHTFEIGFSPFPKELKAPEDRVGIGIASPITERELSFDPKVNIDTSQIGGPSAGLMFSLEIYNQLTAEDLTKGYKIAGTGTLNEEGIVGRIGSAGQKVVAAHKAGAQYFFAPNEGGAKHSNYHEALQVAKEIGTAMQIIPVDTMDDALDFLQSLPENPNVK